MIRDATAAEYVYEGPWLAKVEIVGQSREYIDEIMALSITQSLGDENLSIGKINSAFADITLFTDDRDFAGRQVKVYFKAKYIDGADWHLVGTFNCEKPLIVSNQIQLTAYDNIKYIDAAKLYEPTLTGSPLASEIVADILAQLGLLLSANDDTFSDTPNSERSFPIASFAGMTCLEALRTIAAFFGRNIMSDVDGTVIFGILRPWSSNDPYQLQTKWMQEYSLEELAHRYGGVRCYNGTDFIDNYDANLGRPVNYTCSLVKTSTGPYSAYYAYYALRNLYTVRGHSVTLNNGSPFIQAGDTLFGEYDEFFKPEEDEYNGRFLPIAMNTITYDGTIKNTISLTIDTENQDFNTETISDKFEGLDQTYAQKDHTHRQLNNHLIIKGFLQAQGATISYPGYSTLFQILTDKGSYAISDDDFAIGSENGKTIAGNINNAIWRPLTLASGITAVNQGGYSKPMIRKVGDRVDVVGAVQVTWNGSTTMNLVTDIPSDFRPTTGTHNWIAASEGQARELCRLATGTGGNITLVGIRSITDGSATTAQRWIELNTSWYILTSNNTEDTWKRGD